MKIKLLFISLAILLPLNSNAFTIYSFVPYRYHVDKYGKKVDGYSRAEQALYEVGTKKIKVLYENQFLTNKQPDVEKIKKIVEDTKKNPEIPISFDIEVGNDRKPETVLPIVLKTLKLYHYLGGQAKVGVYSLLPVSTEGEMLSDARIPGYQLLNKKYEPIAELVDFLSPVIYNYNIRDPRIWKKIIDINMAESHKYANKYNLEIYPYITASYYFPEKDPKTGMRYVEPLTDIEMRDRLLYFKQKGADGVILWESSETRQKNGSKPLMDFKSNWAKGVSDFIQKNNSK